MYLAQGHNTVTPVRFELAAPRSQVKHSTTEPLCSLQYHMTSMEKNLSEVQLNKCSRRKKQMTFSGQKNIGGLWVMIIYLKVM